VAAVDIAAITACSRNKVRIDRSPQPIKEQSKDMAERYQLYFTLPQVKALIRALEECGVDSGSPRTELEHFRSTQLVTADSITDFRRRHEGRKTRITLQSLVAGHFT
jgi:inhibitor of KinA sporulation pathway (predicted exonuclease)